MKNDRIAVRLDKETKDALQAAATKDVRSISSMVAKIVAEWLSTLQAAKQKGEVK